MGSTSYVYIALVIVGLVSLAHGQNVGTYRLSGHTRPRHYDLAMRIDVEEQTFSGRASIEIEVMQVTDTVDLHYKDMNVTVEKLLAVDGTEVIAAAAASYSEETEIVKLQYAALTVGQKYNLILDFSGAIRTDLKGLYISTYFDETGLKRHIATTFMAPNYARMAFPCYDEPEFRANYTIHITHAPQFFALSNMPVASVEK